MKNHFHSSQSRPGSPEDISVGYILELIYRKKITLLSSIILFLLLAFLYSYVSEPVYQSVVVIKKEDVQDQNRGDELRRIILLGTRDDIETEIEILKSRLVLEKVVRDLQLNFVIQKYQPPYQKARPINQFGALYAQSLQATRNGETELPLFSEVVLTKPPQETRRYYIAKLGPGTFDLRLADSDSLLAQYNSETGFNCQLGGLSFNFAWPNGKIGSRLYFKIADMERTILQLRKNISTQKIRKTNIFKILVRWDAPLAAQLIARTVTREYINTRMSQKKQTIQYSFKFIDEQLQSVADKLKDAETRLSDYKSEHKLISIDENSRETIEFYSNLEAEKIKTDLELSEFENKYQQIRQAMNQEGFIDQTYLTPSQTNPERSPFSVLLQQLSDAELERLELLQKRKENHPDVRAVDEKISQLKHKLASFNQNTVTAYKIIIETLQKKQAQLQALLNKYSNRIVNLPSQETRLAELLREKNVYEKIFTMLLDKREEMRMADLSQLQDIVVIDSASKPLEPILPNKKFNFLVGFVLGMLSGLALIFLREFRGKHLGNIDEVESLIGLPILTVIPQYDRELQLEIEKATRLENRLVFLLENHYIYKEAYRQLRTKLMNLYPPSTRVILFTSCEEDTGKTTVAANFAMSLGHMGKSVLIIDADLKKSGMAEIFKLNRNLFALGDFLTRDIQLPVYHLFDFSSKSQLLVDFVPAGRFQENSSELLASPKMMELIETAKKKYDYVLIDTPPVLSLVDTVVLGKIVKNAILVIRPHHTNRDDLLFTIRELEQNSMKVLGLVINAYDLNKASPRYRYRYGYGYARTGHYLDKPD